VCGRKYWTHPSVVAFISDSEPTEYITKVAREMDKWNIGASCPDSGAEKVRPQ
jgi:hypothetical protein